MFKKLLSLMALLVSCNALFAATTEPEQKRVVDDPIVFDYITGDDHLYILYKDNRVGLDELRWIVKENNHNLEAGKAHFDIISFVKKDGIGDVKALNEASIQGCVVRSYLKTEYDIPHKRSAFMIDTTMNIKNVVYLQFVDDAMPKDENQDIYCDTHNNAEKERAAIARYGSNVPYISLAMYQAKLRGGVAAEGEMFVLDGDEWKIADGQSTDEVKEVAEVEEYDGSGFDTSVEEYVDAEVEDMFKPVFGLKTNLLYWAVANPNVGVEFYMGNNISLVLEGQYSLFSEFLRRKDRAAYLWNADAEVKFWTKGDGAFDGLYFGLMGGLGQYDLKFGEYGHRGDYANVGLTVGYLLSFNKNFAMEFGVGGGYVGYTDTEYQYLNDHNVVISTDKLDKKGWSLFPTKAQVSLVWRF